MSRATVQQALTGLIPTLNGPLPPELVDLALSLLTRSRSVAHSLKPDEEIARPYACAQLACERLKKRLDLPPITSRPPCPPRIYKKLYKYLESALPDTTSREPQTPKKATASAPASARTTPKTPLSGKKTPRSTKKDEGRAGEPPEWTMRTIRILTKAMDHPKAAPHVYTGVEIILPRISHADEVAPETPSKRPRRGGGGGAATATAQSTVKVPPARLLGLMGALALYVTARMSPRDVTPEEYDKWRSAAISTLLQSPVGKETSADEVIAETEQLVPTAQEEGWLEMEWFQNISPPVQEDEMEGVEMSEGDQARGTRNRGGGGGDSGLRGAGSEYIGLATMMQDATDYLGERQREEYKKWKFDILERLAEIEAS